MKKLMVFFIVFVSIIGLIYGIANENSPSEDSKLQVVAVDKGFNETGDAIMKVFFTFELDKKPIFSKQHLVNIQWNDGWKLESYSLKENGRYRGNDVTVSPFDYNGNMDLQINSKENLDNKGEGEGFVILTSEDKGKIGNEIKSSASVRFNYQSLVKDFTIADSTAWNNADVLD